MIQITPDPTNPDRLILTQTLTLYLDKLLLQTLSDEVAEAIRAQAKKDLAHSTTVKKQIGEAARKMLLQMLGVVEESKND